ncbi:DUF5081 family protein [Enterococcus rivorum]|uniref:Uncharacterized protein n=1 Tax=Enterococcus rivorum TaxID=762845 RepID=A0A1E5KUQ9_9ENTE|nr:DUF5081 family protein [Enterococcus rivorum]MBP2100455.1 hypothetical protein [Enterococcus rivorum]OEH81616.1 hypothetical protein BCR26_16210 [Enterococcus rivorum]
MTTFSEEELLVLANMVGHQELFGVPQLPFYRLNESTFIPKGIYGLQEKGLLDAEKHLTKKGFLVASLIEKYGDSDTYLCLDSIYYVAPLEQSIILKKQEQGFQLTIQEPEALLGQWLTEYTILRREGKPEEQEFRTRRAKLSLAELKEQGGEAALVVGQLTRKETAIERKEYGFLLSEDLLYRLEEKQVKRVSQYWLNKWLVDHLGIFYEKPEEPVQERMNWFGR